MLWSDERLPTYARYHAFDPEHEHRHRGGVEVRAAMRHVERSCGFKPFEQLLTVWMIVLGLMALATVPSVGAEWPPRLLAADRDAAREAGLHIAGSTRALAHAVEHLRGLPDASRAKALGIHATAHGQLQLVNAQGERVTASGADEVRRAVAVLLGGALDADGTGLALYLTEAAVVSAGAAIKELPRRASLFLLTGRAALPAVRREDGRLWSEARPAVHMELSPAQATDRPAAGEVLWTLSRRLGGTAVRIVALDPAGAKGLAPRSKGLPGQAPAPEALEPSSLATAIAALARGVTVVVTGRLEADRLHFKSGAGEQALALGDVRRAAARNDVRLVLVDARPPIQPGERTWLLLRVGVPGLDGGRPDATLGDMLAALASSEGPLVVRIAASDRLRTRLEVRPAGTTSSGEPVGAGLGRALREVITQATGQASVAGLVIEGPSQDRERELAARLVAFLPASVQSAYLLLLAVGAAGWPAAATWWSRIWPPERPSEYAGRSGYWAAWTMRALAFLLVFIPLVAVLAAPVQILRGLGWTARALARLLGRRQPVASAGGG